MCYMESNICLLNENMRNVTKKTIQEAYTLKDTNCKQSNQIGVRISGL
jgi:hypothetical protein